MRAWAKPGLPRAWMRAWASCDLLGERPNVAVRRLVDVTAERADAGHRVEVDRTDRVAVDVVGVEQLWMIRCPGYHSPRRRRVHGVELVSDTLHAELRGRMLNEHGAQAPILLDELDDCELRPRALEHAAKSLSILISELLVHGNASASNIH